MGTSWHNYGKIRNVGHADVAEVFDDPVIVEEKIDGSQFSFGVFDGELRCRSKNKEIYLGEPDGMFASAVETCQRLQAKLHEGWTYRGEFLQKPKHNALAHERVPEGHIIIFDIATAEEQYLSYAEKAAEGARLGLEVVPLLFEGTVESADELRALLDQDSILGGQKIEGVVVKNYSRFGRDGKVMMAKHVSDRYRETQKTGWKAGNPNSKDIIRTIGEKLCTEARWQKAVQHLRDSGELENSPRDIGPLIAEMHRDIDEECGDMIRSMLYGWAKKNVIRHAIRGFPEWYKGQLLDGQFEDSAAQEVCDGQEG